MKKLVSALLASALALSLTACAGSSSSGGSGAAETTEKTTLSQNVTNANAGGGLSTTASESSGSTQSSENKKKELVVATTAEPDVYFSFDDRSSNTNDDSILLQNIYECAFRLMPDGSLQPWLATGYEWSEDGLTLTVHFRDDVYFSNGDHMTADDVVFSWNNVQNATSVKSLWGRQYETTEKVGDYDVAIHLSSPYMPVLVAGVSGRSGGIVNKAKFEELGVEGYTQTPIGTGPYVLTEVKKADHMTFERNENYWGDKKPFYEKITLKFLADANTQILALETHDIDVLLNCNLSPVLKITDPDIGYETAFAAGTMQMMLNTVKGPNTDINFRKALQYAINREDINTVVYDGLSEITDLPIPPFFTDCPELDTLGAQYPQYDPEMAKEYLAKSGYNGEAYVLACQSGKKAEIAAQVIQGQLINIGINCEVKALDSASHRTLIQTDTGWDAAPYDVVQTAMDVSVASSYSNVYQLDTGTKVLTTMADEEMDDLVAQLNAAVDSETRKELGAKIYTKVIDQVYAIPLIYEYNVSAWYKNVEGVKSRPYTGLYFFDEWY